MKHILITGGAGFIGSSVALTLKAAQPDAEVIALDNLKRRGSELNLPRLREAGVAFAHGDIRSLQDILAAGPADLIIEASAEPTEKKWGQQPFFRHNDGELAMTPIEKMVTVPIFSGRLA